MILNDGYEAPLGAGLPSAPRRSGIEDRPSSCILYRSLRVCCRPSGTRVTPVVSIQAPWSPLMHRRQLIVPLLTLCAACKPGGEGIALPQRGKEGLTVSLASPVGYAKVGDRRIAWHPAAEASRYEVVLSDSVEVPIFKAVTRDTQVVIPENFQYSLSQNYRWYVTAYRDRDSTAWRSPLAIFRLEGEGRRMPDRPAP